MEYISLGCDCSVSYQLRKYSLQNNGSMPFDWFRMDKILMINQIFIDIFEKGFMELFNFSEWDSLPQSMEFINNDNQIYKSWHKLKHCKYGIIAPHEYIENDININEFENKYNRRLKKFIDICKNDNILKVFVICGNSKGLKKISVLEDTIEKYVKNYKIICVNYDDYLYLVPKDQKFEWHRNYIPWEDILITNK
jgi:hypothetical protein